MVGKGVDTKTSRIFHQCYLKCCKLQNLTPLNSAIPSGNGKVLDFCVDRIKYPDWPPILNALSCDLSLHSVSIRCRQPVKTVLEHIDCDRLAKTVNKRSVILTKFMLTNLVDATSQLLSNTTLLTVLLLEGLPLKIPYLNPLCEALLANNSLQHLSLPRCLIGDAGCLAICKAVRCLPNILSLDLSGCEITPLGAGYIADLLKYQKIHRYSENWIHTLRYRLPELDAMAGLRRITLCGNTQLTDAGASKLFDELADDLWIKAVDFQNCGLTEQSASNVIQMMSSNTSLVVLDIRHNEDICIESLSKIRTALRANERGMGGQYSWLSNVSGCSSDGRLVKSVISKNGVFKDRIPTIVRTIPMKYVNKNVVKKEKEYAEELEEQLQEEIAHRQQLEELNVQLVDQMKQLKKQQLRLWGNGGTSSGSEQSLQASSRSGNMSTSSGSSSVPIDQNTLSYIQQAFKDIYAFIKDNQCNGHETTEEKEIDQPSEGPTDKTAKTQYKESSDPRVSMVPKKASSAHIQLTENVKMNKTTKSAHLLGSPTSQRVERARDIVEMKPEMFERHMGDTRHSHIEERHIAEDNVQVKQNKEGKNSNGWMTHNTTYDKSDKSSHSSSSSAVSDSSETLVCSPRRRSPAPSRIVSQRPMLNPRMAFYSSSDEDSV